MFRFVIAEFRYIRVRYSGDFLTVPVRYSGDFTISRFVIAGISLYPSSL